MVNTVHPGGQLIDALQSAVNTVHPGGQLIDALQSAVNTVHTDTQKFWNVLEFEHFRVQTKKHIQEHFLGETIHFTEQQQFNTIRLK